MSRAEARKVLDQIPPGGGALSASEFKRRLEALMVDNEVSPEKIRAVLEAEFGPLD